MTEHPAHWIAQMAASAAEELRGYMNPADPSPWNLTDDDHLALLPCLDGAICDLAVCIDGIARMTADEGARKQLTEAASRLLRDCGQIRNAEAILTLRADQRDSESERAPRPAQLAAAGFPESVTGRLLQTADRTPGSPAAPAAAVAAQPFRRQVAPQASRRTGSEAASANRPRR